MKWVEKISDFNTYERLLRFLTFLNLPFTFNSNLGISNFFALQTFLKGTFIGRNGKRRGAVGLWFRMQCSFVLLGHFSSLPKE